MRNPCVLRIAVAFAALVLGCAGTALSQYQYRYPNQYHYQSVSANTAPRGYECPAMSSYPSRCRHMVQCSVWYVEIHAYHNAICTKSDYYWKACCPTIIGGSNTAGRFKERSVDEELKEIAPQQVSLVVNFGLEELKRLSAIEVTLIEHKAFLTTSSPSWGYYVNMKATDAALVSAELGLMVTRATQKLKHVMNLSNKAAGIATQKLKVKGTALDKACLDEPKCVLSKYRTIDGTCNNPNSPLMGSANTQQDRIIAPDYDDGVWEARDKEMPNSRLVSVAIGPEINHMYYDATLILMQWGQLIDHDITHVPTFRLANQTGIECCTPDGKHLPKDLKHPHCFTLDILPGDPFYGQHGVECINFVRSAVAQRTDCNFGYAEQINQVTHWLDASVVYGSSKEQNDLVRARTGGRLKTLYYNNRHLLPLDPMGGECAGSDKGARCFLAGDSRVNQLLALTALQVILLREHNRLADELARINPYWDDEKIYQETRRIVGAIMQHITYNEYLPVLLGRKTMEAHGLLPRHTGYSYNYDKNVTGTILNEFSTAAYRYGHSVVHHYYELLNDKWDVYERHWLRDIFNDNRLMFRYDVLDGVLRGLVTMPPQKFDHYFTKDLTNQLFRAKEKPYGGDLLAFNVWRGRDNGLPGYNHYRELVGLRKVNSFHEMTDTMPADIVDKFSRLYKSPDHIDLYAAGVAEYPTGDSMVGPTFTKIIADQFARLKDGDRFYYENGGQVNSFTEQQLNEIRKVSMAALLCRNGDYITTIQPLVFRPPSDVNPRISCSYIPYMNLQHWKEHY